MVINDGKSLPETEHLPLLTRRQLRRERRKGNTHVPPAAMLLVSAYEGFRGGEELWLHLLELAVGLTFLVLWAREARRRKHGSGSGEHGGGVAFIELAGGGVFALEAIHMWHRHHLAEETTGIHRPHYLSWFYGGLAVVYVALAFWGHELQARVGLFLHAEGFWIRRRLFDRAEHFRWSAMQGASASGETRVLLHWKDGRAAVPIDFSRYPNGAQIRDRLLEHAATRGVLKAQES